jgi:hypothetical protein
VYPSETCDIDILSKTFLERTRRRCLKRQAAPDGLLDALDLHSRLHWLVRQRQDGKPPDGEMGGNDLDPGVVLERYYALNWLVQHEGAEWDDVKTPT